jgi:non-heme chloroperoxidase
MGHKSSQDTDVPLSAKIWTFKRGGKREMRMLTWLGIIVACVIIAFAGAIIFGGPKPATPMASINQPFASVDFSDLPALQTYLGKDGALLAYRHYAPKYPTAKGSIVFVHGSSASSSSMHVLGKAFAKAGFDTFALDIRGHGASGTKGKINYIGQLEDDVEAFVQTVHPAQPSTLAGFSSGGGFVLRFAGGPKQALFQNTLLLSPFLGPDAPNYRPDSGGWVSVGIPRIIALSILNQFGITTFNDLTVTNFALDENAKSFLTPSYTFGLSINFQPNRDYQADIRGMTKPCAMIAGTADEAFFTDKLEDIFKAQGKACVVKLLPGIGHIQLTLDAAAVAAAVEVVGGMQ